MKATARAHANIALVKYWGKRDATLNLPERGSLSLTLDGLTTTTTVTFGGADADVLLIDGVDAGPPALAKAQRVLDRVRQAAGIATPALIESRNDFPTGAGIASSASGLAALALASARAAGLSLSPAELSVLARFGSGSACRSIFGGFVEWVAGSAADGSDSCAHQIAPAAHWDLRALVAVIAAGPKPVGSTEGMTHCRDTSPYHAPFLQQVDADLDAARGAIRARDFAALARVAERSSLRMHAAMIAADPPLIYLQPASWRVIEAVRALREREGVDAFVTVDAGPNPKVFCAREAVPAVRRALEALGVAERLIEARPGPGAEVLP